MNPTDTKPYVPSRVADINAQIASSPLASQGISVAPTTINSNVLASNTTPVNVPPVNQVTTQNAGASVQGITEGQNTGIQNLISAEQTKAQEAQKAQQESTSVFKDYIAKLAGKGEAQVQAEQQAGISEKTQALTDITNEYNTKANEYRRMEEAVSKDAMLTDVQKQARLREISRVKNTELADIGIKQAVAQNNLKIAQDLVDRKIDLQYGDLKDLISYQQEFLKMNREDLTNAEKNILDLKIADNTRQYELGQSIGEFAKQVAANGADANTIAKVSSAKTMAEAVQAAGQYSGNVLDRQIKQAQLAKLNADTAKVIAESATTTGANGKQVTKELGVINDINNILSSSAFDNTFGVTNTISRNFPGTEAYALSSQVNNVLNQLALAARGQLKGQGAVSDFEGRMLRDAQTALKLNLSPDQARAELAKVRGAIATSMGLDAPVAITAPDGSVKYGKADQEMINQAIASGYQVTYQ